MIVNSLEEIKNKKFFAIIIGSGPAGISTALGLERKKIECLIIEAGGLNFDSKNLDYLEWLPSIR